MGWMFSFLSQTFSLLLLSLMRLTLILGVQLKTLNSRLTHEGHLQEFINVMPIFSG